MQKHSTKTNRKNGRAIARLHSVYSNTVRGADPGRIGMLRRKLDAVRKEILAATRGGDFTKKGWLDSEAASLQASISRAESLAAR